MNPGQQSDGSIVLDHGMRGVFVHFVGWWVLFLVGLAAAAVLPLGIVSRANRGEFTWSYLIPNLAWFGIGLGLVFVAVQLFRARRSLATVYLVDNAGIAIRSRDRTVPWALWAEVTEARIDPLLARIQLSTAVHSRPIVLMNGAAPYARFQQIRAVVESRTGSVATLVRPSWLARTGVILCGLSVVPMAWNKLTAGDWRGALMLAAAVYCIHLGTRGMARLRNS